MKLNLTNSHYLSKLKILQCRIQLTTKTGPIPKMVLSRKLQLSNSRSLSKSKILNCRIHLRLKEKNWIKKIKEHQEEIARLNREKEELDKQETNSLHNMHDISSIGEIQDTMKMFFIQACRSRANPGKEKDNIDFGYELSLKLDSSTEKTCLIEQLGGITSTDARGNMPPDASPVEYHCVFADFEPRWTNAVIMFASMSGKVAYHDKYSSKEGGWLIKALEDALESYKEEEEVHILDVLTDINRMVSVRETNQDNEYKSNLKAQSCFQYNITENFYLKPSKQN